MTFDVASCPHVGLASMAGLGTRACAFSGTIPQVSGEAIHRAVALLLSMP